MVITTDIPYKGGLCSGQGETGYGREGALGYERYIAIEHMDVRRDCVRYPVRNKLRAFC